MQMRLAVDGGEPVRKTMLSYGRHWIDEDDILAVVTTLRSDWLTTGPKISEFEDAFARHVGAKYGRGEFWHGCTPRGGFCSGPRTWRRSDHHSLDVCRYIQLHFVPRRKACVCRHNRRFAYN